MNTFLLILRRISLGGFIFLVVSLILKGTIPYDSIGLFLIASPFLYLLFMLFTWLKAKHTTKRLSEETGVDIPSNGYFKTLARGLAIDVSSPIGDIICLFTDKNRSMKTKIVTLVITLLIVLAYLILWLGIK